tara:strand:+ start:325 stop:861 length:537 start_codon:yes stop_codon:yes gene_type:complete
MKSYIGTLLKNLNVALEATCDEHGERVGCASTSLTVTTIFPNGNEGVVKEGFQICLDGGQVSVKEEKVTEKTHSKNDLEVAHQILYEATTGAMSSRSLQKNLSASNGTLKVYRVKELKEQMNSELDKQVPILQLQRGCDAYYIEPRDHFRKVKKQSSLNQTGCSLRPRIHSSTPQFLL